MTKERFCWVCGASMGLIEDRLYDRRDTCGARACDEEAAYQEGCEREEAHRIMDEERGWR